jgi:hypothetical protein
MNALHCIIYDQLRPDCAVSDTKEKPFQCGCGASYARRDLLTRHARHGCDNGDSVGNDQVHPSSRNATSSNNISSYVEHHALARHSPDSGAAVGLDVGPGWANQTQDAGPHAPDVMGDFDTSSFDAFAPFDHFGQFAYNLDGLGLPDDWGPYLHSWNSNQQDDAICRIVDQPPQNRCEALPDNSAATVEVARCGTPFSAWLPTALAGDETSLRLPDHSKAPLTHALRNI